MKQIISLLLFIPFFSQAQTKPSKAPKKLGPNPIMIVDSNRITKSELMSMDANTIALVTILNDTTAYKEYGYEGKDGVVIMQTKPFAIKQYTSYFRKISPQYDSLYTVNKSDSTFQYILNDKIETKDFEGNLALINDDVFISLEILSADDLKHKYNITDKPVGVLVRSRKPDGLYHANKKF